MDKMDVSVVSYLNSRPFIYGLQHSSIQNKINLSLDTPAECASKLINGKAQVGLVPVAAINQVNKAQIITDFCIGADGRVDSVLLLSRNPLEKINRILLDYQSRTSVQLVKILARQYWKIEPEFMDASSGFENQIEGGTAAVVIGDRALAWKEDYEFSLDLALEWKQFTSLPFVFACWVSNVSLGHSFLKEFNEALQYGLNHRNELITELRSHSGFYPETEAYLKNRISYDLNDEKRKGMELFLQLIG